VKTGVGALAQELHSSVTAAPGSEYQRALLAWKKRSALVGVPFLLSPGYGILWPRPGSSTESERTFLRENSDFLSGKSATPVFANIAVVHKEEVLAEARKLDSSLKKSAAPAASQPAEGPARDKSAGIKVSPPHRPRRKAPLLSLQETWKTSKPSTRSRRALPFRRASMRKPGRRESN
jgi:hypothetical protein